VPFPTLTRAFRHRIQLSVDGDWQPDYPAPSAYLPAFFGCRGGFGNGYVCDPSLDRALRRATAREAADARRSSALWARVDRKVTDNAYWVPTVSLRAPELVSGRVRNYQHSPLWGFIAGQVWLR
jgi:ABC-type oligopeptide transport system substrate-binding subunit